MGSLKLFLDISKTKYDLSLHLTSISPHSDQCAMVAFSVFRNLCQWRSLTNKSWNIWLMFSQTCFFFFNPVHIAVGLWGRGVKKGGEESKGREGRRRRRRRKKEEEGEEKRKKVREG